MAFRFPLAPVLVLRKLTEERACFELEKIQQEIVRIEAQVTRINDWLTGCVKDREMELAKGTSSVPLQARYEQIMVLEQRQAALDEERQQLHSKRSQRLKEYQQARQRREVLEKLHERQFNEYVRRESKRQQSALDDLFLSRRQHGK